MFNKIGIPNVKRFGTCNLRFLRKIMYGKILKYFYYTLIGLFLLILGSLYLSKNQLIFADEFKSESLDAFVNDFYPWAITISAGLAVIMLIYSGYLYVTSAGNMEQINKAKEYIIGALSGLAFLILAALIFRTISV